MSKYKILVIAPMWVGDLVMSQVLFKQLSLQYLDALELDVFALNAYRSLLMRMEEVNAVISNPFLHHELSLCKRISIARNLRQKQYNQVIVLPNSFKSAIIARFAGINKRTGFVGEMRFFLLNDIYKLDTQKLPRMVDRFAALANNGIKPKEIFLPNLLIDDKNQAMLLKKFNVNKNNKIIALCPGAEYGKSKRWLPEYFANLSDLLLNHEKYQFIILGNAKDFAIGNEIVHYSKNKTAIINLCGQTELQDAIDLLDMCQFCITNDSGLMHIACATSTKVVAIYGSSSPDFTPPLSINAKQLHINLNCSPCFARVCKYGHYNCMKFLTPRYVFEQIISMLH